MHSLLRQRDSLHLTTSQLATPPPATMRQYPEGIGWVDAHAIGFHGFNDEHDAARAAAVAYRAMEERLTGGRAHSIDADTPVTISRHGEIESVVVGSRPIARLVRPDNALESATRSVAFELEVPIPVNRMELRAIAEHLEHELHRAGVVRGSDIRMTSASAPTGLTGLAPTGFAPTGAVVIDRWIQNRILVLVAIGIAVLTASALAAPITAFSSTLVFSVLGAVAALFVVFVLFGRMLRDVKIPAGVFRRRERSLGPWFEDPRFWSGVGETDVRT